MQGVVVNILNAASGKHYDIHRGQVILAKTDGFSNETLKTVAIDGAFDIFLADHESKAGMSPGT